MPDADSAVEGSLCADELRADRVEELRAVSGVQCVRSKNWCVTHNCVMTRTIVKVRKWTKVKHGFAHRTQAKTRWNCVLENSRPENHATSQVKVKGQQ